VKKQNARIWTGFVSVSMRTEARLFRCLSITSLSKGFCSMQWISSLRQKGDTFPCQVMKTDRKEWNVGVPFYLWHLAQLGEQSCQLCSTCWPQCTPKTVPRNSFLLRAEWTPGVRNEDRWKISKDPTKNRTRSLPSCDTMPRPTASLLAPIGLEPQVSNLDSSKDYQKPNNS